MKGSISKKEGRKKRILKTKVLGLRKLSHVSGKRAYFRIKTNKVNIKYGRSSKNVYKVLLLDLFS